jgi:Protein of unknown function (DUF2817)
VTPTSGILSSFADNYAEARDKFRAAAEAAGARLEAHRHPLAGPAGEALFVDLAWLGPVEARRLLITVSGTHGVEGYCGSGCQVAWLQERGREALPPDTAMLLVHAINPWGFAWTRRVNEDNVDINRNFIDFSAPLPENPGWRRLARAVCPERWDEGSAAVYKSACRRFIAEQGEPAFVRAVSGGQYEDADGIFYGGRRPVWSHALLHRFALERLAGIERLCVVDFHTGLGPHGNGELICRHAPESESLKWARRWWGDSVTSPALGQSVSPLVSGNLRMAFGRWLPRATVVAAGLEFGTHPEDRVFEALRADNWLYQHGDPGSRAGHAIRAEMREMFYPATPEWKALVLPRAFEVQEQAVRGLSA